MNVDASSDRKWSGLGPVATAGRGHFIGQINNCEEVCRILVSTRVENVTNKSHIFHGTRSLFRKTYNLQFSVELTLFCNLVKLSLFNSLQIATLIFPESYEQISPLFYSM